MRILLALGGKPYATAPVGMGLQLAQETGAQLTLLTVARRADQVAQAEAQQALARERLARAGVEADTRVVVGHAAEQIVREAREGAHDLLVMGERPLHRLIKRLLGPTAERVIAQLPCPILIARRDTDNLDHILLCESGREPSLLVRLSHNLLPLLKIPAQITVLHVMSQIAAAPTVAAWELEADADILMRRGTAEGQILQRDLEMLAAVDARVAAKVRHGLVVDEIAGEVAESGCNLLVIGAHQHLPGWEGYLLDDLTRQIVSRADCSVLIV